MSLGCGLYQQGPERPGASWEPHPATDVTQRKGCSPGGHGDEGIWLEPRETPGACGQPRTGSVIPGREDTGGCGRSGRRLPTWRPCQTSPRPSPFIEDALQAGVCVLGCRVAVAALTLEPWPPTRAARRLGSHFALPASGRRTRGFVLTFPETRSEGQGWGYQDNRWCIHCVLRREGGDSQNPRNEDRARERGGREEEVHCSHTQREAGSWEGQGLL